MRSLPSMVNPAISVELCQAGVDTVTLYGPRLMSLADTSGV
jgi:hypothetical protein